MKGICENIYKSARKNAGYEQVEAAEALGISARSLQNYESDINASIPQLDTIRNMCILYKDKSLAYKHIKNSPIADFMPDYDVKPLSMATLEVLNNARLFNDQIAMLIEITKDNKIDKEEEVTWNQFYEVANKLLESLNILLNSKSGGGLNVDNGS